MELLSEYDGAQVKSVKKNATVYLNENDEWTADFYVAGTIVKTESFPGATESEVQTKAALYKEGVAA